ncbi:hypothetical protein [Polymorphobacter sp.]|uniref:hypothetical protein n=1 Tax=Polymorphobacter sp. TaxID=1909290 RepID=UPI003F6F1832
MSEQKLRIGEIWQGIVDLLRERMGLFFAVAAPFTLLVDMALRIFGPAPPATMADVTSRTLFWLIVLPGIIGSLAQLTIAGLILRPGATPRMALAAAFAVWPSYLAALMLSALPSGLGFLLLLLPGLYITARLFLIVPLALAGERTDPLSLIRTSWTMTAPAAWPLFGFFILGLVGLFGLGLIAGGVGGALGSVLTLIGLADAAQFAAGLVPALASTVVAIATAAAACVIYSRLA